MRSRIRTLFSLLASLPACTLPLAARADLPDMEDPSRGQGDGIMETLQNYGYDIVILMSLAICAVGFLVVANSCISTYSEIQTGKKQWKDLGAMAGVGAVLLVICIWLLTEAGDIL
jgi:integrating conjugative element membrane protein (TIGR03745 family)